MKLKVGERNLRRRGLAREALQTEEPKPWIFDPTKELPEGLLQRLLSDMDAYQKQRRNLDVLIRSFVDLQILYPNQPEVREMAMRQKTWLRERWESLDQGRILEYPRVEEQCDLGLAWTQLFPEERSVVEANGAVLNLWDRIKKLQRGYSMGLTYLPIYTLLPLEERFWVRSQKCYSELCDAFENGIRNKHMLVATNALASLRLLFPDQFKPENVALLKPIAFEKMPEQILAEQQARIGAKLKIVSWPEVWVADNGKIEFGEISELPQPAPLPERKLM